MLRLLKILYLLQKKVILHFGFKVQFPNKWEGQGKFLMDGSNPDHDWQSFIPREFNAHTKNPETWLREFF